MKRPAFLAKPGLSLITALISLMLISCGTSSFEGLTGVPQTPSGPALQSGQQLFGRLYVMPTFLVDKAADRRAALFSKDLLQERGLIVSESGDVVLWPEKAAGGWLVDIGGTQVLTNADGTFSVTLAQDGLTQGELSLPNSPNLSPVKFDLALLSTSPEKPTDLLLPLPFGGGCGMGEDDFCGDSVSARYSPPTFDPNNGAEPTSANVIPWWGVERRRLGTYPPPESHIRAYQRKTCPQFDGYFADGTSDVSGQNYFGSTCDLNVLDGACPNENGKSDIEYQQFVGGLPAVDFSPDIDTAAGIVAGYVHSIRASIDSPDAGTVLIGPLGAGSGISRDQVLTPPEKVKIDDLSCLINHKGRQCGMFEAGDLSLDIGEVVRGGAEGRLYVAKGSSGTFTVHNNGVFGYTDVRDVSGEQVTLTVQPAEVVGGVRRLKHFDPSTETDGNLLAKKPHTYVPDRQISYQVSENAQVGDETTFTFSVDDQMVTLVFEIQGDVRISPAKTTLGLDDMQTFTAEVPDAIKDSATYEWRLNSDTGGLSSATGREVTYTVGDFVEAPALETISVEVTVDGEIFGTASAQIRITDVEIIVSPSDAILMPGDTQIFSATVRGLVDKVVYEWQSVNGFGAVTSPTTETTDYTVLNSFIPPGKDILRLTVYSEDAEGNRTFEGTEDVLIDIEEELQGTVRISPPSAGGLYSSAEAGEERIFTATVFDVPNGATVTYEWESLNGYGTIDNPEERVITYEANSGLTPPLKDELRVTVYTQEAGQPRKRFATAVVDVHIDQLILFVDMTADSWKSDGAVYFNGGAMAVYDVEPIPRALDYRITVIEQSFDAIPSYIGGSTFLRADDPDSLELGAYRHISARGSTSSLSAASRDAWVAGRLAFYQSQTGRARVVVNFEQVP